MIIASTVDVEDMTEMGRASISLALARRSDDGHPMFSRNCSMEGLGLISGAPLIRSRKVFSRIKEASKCLISSVSLAAVEGRSALVWFRTYFRFPANGVGDPSVMLAAQSPSNDSNPVSYSVSLACLEDEFKDSLVSAVCERHPLEVGGFDCWFLCLGVSIVAWDIRPGVSMSSSEEILSSAVWNDSARDDEDKWTKLFKAGRLVELFVRGGVTSGVGGLEVRRGVNVPVVRRSETEEAIFWGVRSSIAVS